MGKGRLKRLLRARSVGKLPFDPELQTSMRMAADHQDHTDLKPHVQTYSGMIAMLKWGTVAAVILTAIVIWIIAT